MIMRPGMDDAARRGAFASMMAHELRTPLTAAYGALELMTRAGAAAAPDDDRTAQLLGLAHRNTRRLLRIVEDCLDLEASSDGRLVLDRSVLQPSDVVVGGVDGARCAREQTGVDVEYDCRATQVILGDRSRLGRALAHLVQNAVTFAPAGTAVTVSTVDDASRGMVRYAVEDRGAGIAPDDLRALFQRFDVRQPSGRTRVGGLGMGLAFVRTIAEHHGGAVGAESAPGRTLVWFEVPRDGMTG